MRWKGILFLLVLFGIVLALNLFFTDQWLERRLENAGATLVGAKVEIDHLDFSFLDLHIRWDSLQVTNAQNTMKNIFTSGKTDFHVELLPLLEKKVVIDNIKMIHVSSGTDRSTDGKIEKAKAPSASKPNVITKTINRLQQQISDAPAWNLTDYTKKVNVDSIIQFLNIQSPQKIDSLQKALKIRYAYWDSVFASVKWKDDLSFLESRLSTVKPEEIKTIEDLQSTLTLVQQMRRKIDSLQTFVTKTKSGLVNDLEQSSSKVTQVDDWIKQDYNQALEKARLPQLSKENIARFLFGKQTVNQATQVLTAVNTVRSFSEKWGGDKPEKQKPPRMRGQTIYFTAQQRYPAFWIKNLQLSGQTTRGLEVEGTVKNIVTQQKIIGQPMTLQMGAKRSDGAKVHLVSEFNYLSDSPREIFKLELAGMPLQNVQLSDSPLLPHKIARGIAQLGISLELGSDKVRGDLLFSAENLLFDFDGPAPDKRLEKIVRQILQTVTRLNLKATLSGSQEHTIFGLDSDLDELFARELKSMLSGEVEKARAKIEAYVSRQVSRYKEQLNALVTAKTSKLQTDMVSYENLIGSQKQVIEDKQKQLQARIEEERQTGKKKVEQGVKKLLKGIGK